MNRATSVAQPIGARGLFSPARHVVGGGDPGVFSSSAAAEANSKNALEDIRWLGAGDRVTALEDEAGHAGDAHAARNLALPAHLRDAFLAGQKAAYLVLVEAAIRPGSGEDGTVADVLALLEIAVEQSLDHLILHALRPAKAISRCEVTVLGVRAMRSKAKLMPSASPAYSIASKIWVTRSSEPNFATM